MIATGAWQQAFEATGPEPIYFVILLTISSPGTSTTAEATLQPAAGPPQAHAREQPPGCSGLPGHRITPFCTCLCGWSARGYGGKIAQHSDQRKPKTTVNPELETFEPDIKLNLKYL